MSYQLDTTRHERECDVLGKHVLVGGYDDVVRTVRVNSDWLILDEVLAPSAVVPTNNNSVDVHTFGGLCIHAVLTYTFKAYVRGEPACYGQPCVSRVKSGIIVCRVTPVRFIE